MFSEAKFYDKCFFISEDATCFPCFPKPSLPKHALNLPIRVRGRKLFVCGALSVVSGGYPISTFGLWSKVGCFSHSHFACASSEGWRDLLAHAKLAALYSATLQGTIALEQKPTRFTPSRATVQSGSGKRYNRLLTPQGNVSRCRWSACKACLACGPRAKGAGRWPVERCNGRTVAGLVHGMLRHEGG